MAIMDKTATTNSTRHKNTILDAALAYHQQGLRVVILHNLTVTHGCSCQLGSECLHPGKHPRKGGWNKPGAGMLETPDDIRDAFTRYPRANVGIITGGSQYSNIICIDVDPKHGGEESLATLLAANAQFPPTWQARTGSGGSHYLFKHPGPGWIVRNSQADDKKHHPKLGTGLDVKGDRGQFVVAPSAHASGKRYEWINPPGGDVPLAELPEWLRALIAEPKDKSERKRKRKPSLLHSENRIQKWAQKAIDLECQNIINAPAGSGSDALTRSAFNLGQLVGGGGIAYDDAFRVLLEAATFNNRRPELEAAKTIKGQLEFGMTKPRTPPEKVEIGEKIKPNTSAMPVVSGEVSTTTANEHDDDPHRLARAFIERFGTYDGKQRLWKWRQDWFNWSPNFKCYREVHKAEMKDQLCGFIKMHFDQLAEESDEKVKKVSGEILNNTMNALSSYCLLKTSRVETMPAWLGIGSPKLLPLANGLLDYESITSAETVDDVLMPHTPEWFSLSMLPVDFHIEATCPKWTSFLEKNLEGDQERISLLQEWFGYCLTYDTGFQSFLVLHGEGANGKSVICAALIALLGMQNISTVPLELFGERFQLATTLGKLANITADVGEIDRAAEGQIKSFTSGDTMHFDRKNKDAFEARPTARLVIATNTLPRFNDKSSGIWRRILLMPLNVTISEDERVPNMDKPEWWKAQSELSGILNWALVGRHRLYQQGKFTHSATGKAALEEYKDDTNPARRFFNDEITIEEERWTQTEDIYKAYIKWCKQSNCHPLNDRGFGKELARHVSRVTTWKDCKRVQRRVGGKQRWGYTGITVSQEFIE